MQATPISDFVAVSLSGTAPLSFVSTGSSTQLAFDITGSALNSSLQSWQQQVNALGVSSVQISQYEPNVVRLTAQVSPDVFYTSGTEDGGTQLNLWLQEPAAKQELLAKPASGTIYYGFDATPYPGDNVMQAWWNDSPFCYTGFYLGPSAYHSDASFMNKRQTLVNQGWGLLPIYVGRQADSDHLDTPTGIADADDAANLAVSAGFPTQYHYLSGYRNRVPVDKQLPELCHHLGRGGSWQGVWCRDLLQHQNTPIRSGVRFRAPHSGWRTTPETACRSSVLSPADTGVSYAGSWQFTGDSSLTYGGDPIDVDLDASTYRDPSTAPGNASLGNISLW